MAYHGEREQKTRMQKLEALIPIGVTVECYSPGDGRTRWQFYRGARKFYTAFGYKAAEEFATGLGFGHGFAVEDVHCNGCGCSSCAHPHRRREADGEVRCVDCGEELGGF